MLRQFGLPLAITAVLLLLLLLAIWSGRRGVTARLWASISHHPLLTMGIAALVPLLVALAVLLNAQQQSDAAKRRARQAVETRANLLANPNFVPSTPDGKVVVGWQVSDAQPDFSTLAPNTSITGTIMPVRSNTFYRYSFSATSGGSANGGGGIQLRVLWYNPSLDIISWYDTPPLPVLGDMFHTETVSAPEGAAFAQMIFSGVGPASVKLKDPTFISLAVVVEAHPNAARASLAFSFDWESAMGGLIHSKGSYDPATAVRRGMEMRQGADWLNQLFGKYGIRATFYATGYNLLDGNRARRLFAGNPTYRWAQPRNGWASDYWLTHLWYSDDPYGDATSHPEWYFGDQTRALQEAKHEIASHTFGHLYVRGATPQELGEDTDEWLNVAADTGVPPPVTFAFPWRSSNSLTPDFYEILYTRGIRAVTRIYERDMRDLYTLAAVPRYPQMALMPDFLLGAPEGGEIEEADGGQVIGLGQGMRVLREVIVRRGTTSFWTHPEQLAPDPRYAPVREAWEGVTAEAARHRDTGNLWIATVADITDYQSSVAKVDARLERGTLGTGTWKLIVSNSSGRELSGVTLTLPGEVRRAKSNTAQLLFVTIADASGSDLYGDVQLAETQDKPARQLVLNKLQPGVTELEIEWVSGEEPLE